ncbi:hypothetical protein, partial [Candidatus Hakubella thermalkaliphila]|uniref:hypothetical protein n=1 Tax=Candidatus Hakubella thermalkaliphila TaxID=2754717 RepID=UPI001C611885
SIPFHCISYDDILPNGWLTGHQCLPILHGKYYVIMYLPCTVVSFSYSAFADELRKIMPLDWASIVLIKGNE